MGKKNSKLKQDTIDRLTTATYCRLIKLIDPLSSTANNSYLIELPVRRRTFTTIKIMSRRDLS